MAHFHSGPWPHAQQRTSGRERMAAMARACCRTSSLPRRLHSWKSNIIVEPDFESTSVTAKS
eukprot:632771-Prymnesium_polylepis.1